MYNAPCATGHISKIELNLTHFNTNPNFLLHDWKDLTNLNLKQLEVFKKALYGDVMWERNTLPLRNQYIFT